MTSHTKHYIELSDIAGLRLECKGCGTAMLVPMRENPDLSRLRNCPTCQGALLVSIGNQSVQREIEDFVSAWNSLKKVFPPEGKFSSDLILTLEIKDGSLSLGHALGEED